MLKEEVTGSLEGPTSSSLSGLPPPSSVQKKGMRYQHHRIDYKEEISSASLEISGQ